MKKTLRNKVSTIRNKVLELVDDLYDRKYDLEERDDPDGVWQEEMDEIDQLIDILDQVECDLGDYE